MDIVHGHSPGQLEHLLYEAWPALERPPSFDAVFSDGLSNINILGNAGEIRFVLKLPQISSPHSEALYDRTFRVSQYVYEYGLGPRPLKKGRFFDSLNMPFIVLEYVSGTIYASIADLTLEHQKALRHGLMRLKQLCPPELPAYSRPEQYVASLFERVSMCLEETKSSVDGVIDLAKSFCNMRDDVLEAAESIEIWSGRFMHGDLREDNIVFTHRGAVFLDFEESCFGEPLVDLAYLRVQPIHSHSLNMLVPIMDEPDAHGLLTYEAPALVFAISWTLEHLIPLASGLAELSLQYGYSEESMTSYVKKKMTELEANIAS